MENRLARTGSTVQTTLVAIAILLGMASVAVPATEITNPLTDFSTLNLQVTGTRIVDKIVEPDIITGKPRIALSARAPDRLVVITLEGVVPAENYYTCMPDSFSLLCESKMKTGSGEIYPGSRDRTTYVIKQCRAIRIVTGTSDKWTIRGQNYSVTLTHLFRPGPVKIEIGVVVDPEVNTFAVIIPASVPGQVAVPAISEADATQTENESATVEPSSINKAQQPSQGNINRANETRRLLKQRSGSMPRIARRIG